MPKSIINVTKLEMHSPAFRAVLKSDQANALIRATGRMLGKRSGIHCQTHVVPSDRFKDARLIGFVGGKLTGSAKQVQRDKEKLEKAFKRSIRMVY